MSLWCLQIDQNNNEIFVTISALVSKSQIKKIRAPNTTNWMIFLFRLSYTTFLFDLFLETMIDLKTPKEHFEIITPLDVLCLCSNGYDLKGQ